MIYLLFHLLRRLAKYNGNWCRRNHTYLCDYDANVIQWGDVVGQIKKLERILRLPLLQIIDLRSPWNWLADRDWGSSFAPVRRSFGSSSSLNVIASNWTRWWNLYVSASTRTGIPIENAIMATTAVPAREITAPFEKSACAPEKTLLTPCRA